MNEEFTLISIVILLLAVALGGLAVVFYTLSNTLRDELYTITIRISRQMNTTDNRKDIYRIRLHNGLAFEIIRDHCSNPREYSEYKKKIKDEINNVASVNIVRSIAKTHEIVISKSLQTSGYYNKTIKTI